MSHGIPKISHQNIIWSNERWSPLILKTESVTFKIKQNPKLQQHRLDLENTTGTIYDASETQFQPGNS